MNKTSLIFRLKSIKYFKLISWTSQILESQSKSNWYVLRGEWDWKEIITNNEISNTFIAITMVYTTLCFYLILVMFIPFTTRFMSQLTSRKNINVSKSIENEIEFVFNLVTVQSSALRSQKQESSICNVSSFQLVTL